MRFLKTNTATRVVIGPFLDKTDGVTPEVSLTVTGLQVELYSEDNAGGAPTRTAFNPTASGGNNDMVHIASDVAGMYDLELTAAQLNFLGRLILVVTKADTHLSVWHEYMVIPALVWDSLFAGTDNLQVDAIQVSGTTQTARDVGASVLLSSGTGTGQLDFTSGVVKANLVQILASAITGTAAQISAAFTKFFDKASPTGTINSLPDAVPGANGGLPTTNGTTVNQTVNLVASQSGVTIGTVTNLTNAPTAGDLTATMKTSVTTAATAATPSVTVSDKTGFALSTAGVKAIWDQLTSALSTVGSIGKKLTDWVLGSDSKVLLSADAQTGVTIPTVTTVGTVTNLTNAPTNGDLTATMKASVTTAATAATPTVTLANGAHGGAAAVLTLERAVVASATTNQPAVKLTGNGSGAGLQAVGGASGPGIKADGTGGAGILATASASNFYGLHCIGAGATESGGIKGIANTSGEGLEGVGAGNGHGLLCVGAGSGEGLHATAGGGANAHGAHFEGAGANSSGVLCSRGGAGGDDLAFANNDCTIPTVTNLTNAPTNGDLTAAMKASVNAEVDTAISDAAIPAGVKTAIEVDGSKLDHLWETTEDDAGVRRFTANALEQAPSGGGGGGFTTGDRTTIEQTNDLVKALL